MMPFECLRCGMCCGRIIITGESDLSSGLSLLPGEVALFAEFPDAVLPFIALQKPRGKPHRKVICHQMVQEPCPLYDPDTKSCTQYEKRPVVCRAYPFKLRVGGLLVDPACAADASLVGKSVEQFLEPYESNLRVNSYFLELGDLMKQTGYTVMTMFDVVRKEWKRIEAKR